MNSKSESVQMRRAHGGASCATQLSRRLSASNRAQEQCAELIYKKDSLKKKISSNCRKSKKRDSFP